MCIFLLSVLVVKCKSLCPRWGSNSRPSDYETDALPTALRRQCWSCGLEENFFVHCSLNWRRKSLFVVMRQPGIEPGSTAWKAAMLTTIPLTLTHLCWEEWKEWFSGPFLHTLAKRSLPWPGFEPGLLRPQRRVLTTRRSRLGTWCRVPPPKYFRTNVNNWAVKSVSLPSL